MTGKVSFKVGDFVGFEVRGQEKMRRGNIIKIDKAWGVAVVDVSGDKFSVPLGNLKKIFKRGIRVYGKGKGMYGKITRRVQNGNQKFEVKWDRKPWLEIVDQQDLVLESDMVTKCPHCGKVLNLAS